MAICIGAITLWRRLKGILPKAPTVLEIGESNWFGDVDPRTVPELAGRDIPADLFDLAKVYYKAVLDYTVLDSVDAGGKTAMPHDLNKPLPLDNWYDIVINGGTAEHVFDQAQVYRTIHQMTAPGGLMVHCFPVAGCTDHGYYTYSPCLIRDLAEANHYLLLEAVECVMGGDKTVYIAWRKRKDIAEAFVIPQQKSCKGIMGGEFKGVA